MSTRDVILTRVTRWPGVRSVPDGRDDIVLSVAGRELARLHGDAVDLPLTRPLRDQLLTDGMADRHLAAPRSEWVTYRVRSDADVAGALKLLRLAYCRHLLVDGGNATGDAPPTEAAEPADGSGQSPPTFDPRRELARLSFSPDVVALVSAPDDSTGDATPDSQGASDRSRLERATT